VRDNGLPKDREASPLPSSVNMSKNNYDSDYQGARPEETSESASMVAFNCQRDQHGSAGPPPTSPKKASIPTPQPPSIEEMKTIIKSKIKEASGGLCSDADGITSRDVDWWLEEDADEEIKKVVRYFSADFSIIEMLETFGKRLSSWIGQFESQTGFHISFRLDSLISDWGDALYERRILKMSLIELQEYRDYPFNYELDRDLLIRAMRTFPDVDIFEQTNKKIIWWKEHPDSLKPIYKPVRIQLWEYFQKQDKWLRDKKKNDEES
jgi:hypothetical protein